jgi:hypothetical protein
MKKARINTLLWIAVFFIVCSPLPGENISFKISYNTASVSKGDLRTWIDSYNDRWADWQSQNSGQLNGQLNPLKYGPLYEIELRIPLFAGFGFNVCGSHFKSMEESTISFVYDQQNQGEKDFIRNEVSGIPIKIGISYAQALPFSKNLFLFAGVGRHITFLKYKFNRENELRIGDVNTYVYKQENTFNSEALGFYATFGAEYNIIKQIAIVVEAEKVWSKADGFKGPFTTDFFDPFENSRTIEEGKASLYFYENKPFWNNKYYSILSGHEKKPEDPEDYPVGIEDIRNIRQGELDLSTLSIKIGIRFKF